MDQGAGKKVESNIQLHIINEEIEFGQIMSLPHINDFLTTSFYLGDDFR